MIASKSVGISDKVSIPLFVKLIVSPIIDYVYPVSGVGVLF